jgi:hypothetical protein
MVTLRRKAQELGYEPEVKRLRDKTYDSRVVKSLEDAHEYGAKIEMEVSDPLVSLKLKHDRELAQLLSRQEEETRRVQHSNEKEIQIPVYYASSARNEHKVASSILPCKSQPNVGASSLNLSNPSKFFKVRNLDANLQKTSKIDELKELCDLSFGNIQSSNPITKYPTLSPALLDYKTKSGRNLIEDIGRSEHQPKRSQDDEFDHAFF